MKKCNPAIIGLIQAIGVVMYCVFIALIIGFLSRNFPQPPSIWGPAIMLTLLVFSAAVTGSIVFGYPAYLFLKEKKIKIALQILAYTLIYCLLFILAAFIAVFIV